MKLRQKPQSGIWLVDFEHPETGKRQRVSTGTKDRPEALRKARLIVQGLAEEDTPKAAAEAQPKAKRRDAMTMRELFDLCLKDAGVWRHSRSMATLHSNLKVMEPLIGDDFVDEMDKARLKEIVRHLEERGYKPATIKRKMDMVGRALTHAVDEGIISTRPKGVTIKVENLKSRVVSYEEEAAIFRALEARIEKEPQRQWARFKHLLAWLLDTGCRLGESLHLREAWIDRVQGDRLVVRIPAEVTKTNKDRSVPLSRRIEDSLPVLRLTAVKGRLFPMVNGTAWYMFATIKEDVAKEGLVNIDDVTLHTMRHTCITRLVKGRMPLIRVSKWAGHADVKITQQRYAHLDEGDLMEGLDILDAPPPPNLRLVG